MRSIKAGIYVPPSILKVTQGQYFGTSDCTVGEILNLERVDKYGYEGWIEKDKIIIVQEKKLI